MGLADGGARGRIGSRAALRAERAHNIKCGSCKIIGPKQEEMGTEIHTIGLANGGGDCPGLNAAIRGVVKAAITQYGWRVIGITNGFDGLIWPERCVELTLDSVRGILPRGGTILGTTNHGNPFAYPIPEDGAKVTRNLSGLCLENISRLGLDALVVIGGDGTLSITRDLARLGVRVVGMPKTIDNDLPATEVTFGFDTALHVATDAIDRLHTTAESHGRVMVIEVMGREAGWIALHSGIAGGADVILVPEIPFRIEHVCRKILQREAAGRKFSLVVVAEGARLPAEDAMGRPLEPAPHGQVGLRIGDIIGREVLKEVRVTVLGHIQRGGSPSPFDRVLATRFGCSAADLVAEGGFGRMVCLRAGKIESVPLEEAVGTVRTVDPLCDHVRTARSVGISFGDGV
jgi:ATP-dependent phosphofructokinase / diphosphate-dependent phosphofructokinase